MAANRHPNGLSSSALKIIALIAMTIDHFAAVILVHSHTLDTVVFRSGMTVCTWYDIMRWTGRLAFPIFAFLLCEGYSHTRNRLRYGLSLLVMAILSEVPYNLALHGGMIWNANNQNIFFTLLAGYLCITVYDKFKEHLIESVLLIASIIWISELLKFDYGYMGVAFITLLYIVTRNDERAGWPLTAALLPMPLPSAAAFVPISLYDGERGFVKGPILKYAFYLYYPVHLLVIHWLSTSIL